MRWLRGVISLLAGLALLGAAAACTWQGLKPDGNGMQRLYIAGSPAHVEDREVIAATAGHLGAGFFDLDIEALRDAVVALPWVAGAQVHRRWPDGVVVQVREHQPVALWGDAELLAADGSVFRPPEGELPEDLPRLAGPDNARHKLRARLPELREALAPMAREVARVRLSPRGAWTVTLAGGLDLRLGRSRIVERAARFAARGPAAIGEALTTADYVDLRYDNGFAVGGTQAAPNKASKESTG